MHTLRRRIDEARQCVRIGRFQFRQLPPVENATRQFMSLIGEIFEKVGKVIKALA